MTEGKSGFLGLTDQEWSRALSLGGLSLIPTIHEGALEQDMRARELSHQEMCEKARDLARIIAFAKNELEHMPREILVEIAWSSIAHHHVAARVWGLPPEGVERLEREKDARLSVLTEDELELANTLANDWLDVNFDQ